MARGPAPPAPDPARVRHLSRSLRQGMPSRQCQHGVAYTRGPCASCDAIEDRCAAIAADRRRRHAELNRALSDFVAAAAAGVRMIEAVLIPTLAKAVAAATIRRRPLDDTFGRLAAGNPDQKGTP
jgi:hypothetical protein